MQHMLPQQEPPTSPIEKEAVEPPKTNETPLCEGCLHSKHDLSMQTDGGYFSANYHTKRPLWPKQCSGTIGNGVCGVLFVDKKKKDVVEGECEVTARAPVFACCNATNIKHNCMFALCIHCHDSPSNKREQVVTEEIDDTRTSKRNKRVPNKDIL